MTVVVTVGWLGAAAPGLWMSPADTDMVNARLRTITAHTWRKDFTWLPPSMTYKNFVAYKNLVSTLEQP